MGGGCRELSDVMRFVMCPFPFVACGAAGKPPVRRTNHFTGVGRAGFLWFWSVAEWEGWRGWSAVLNRIIHILSGDHARLISSP